MSDLCAWFMMISLKQALVAKSTCIAELYAVNTVGDNLEWAIQFMEELGFPQETVVVEQDNTCSMQLLKMGTGSFKRSKHVKVRYFWLKELIDEGRIILKYVKSEEMVSDLLTKSITGAKFRNLRKLLLGW
jgi:hypothetical protein